MIDEKKLIDKFKDWIRTDYFEDWSARNFMRMMVKSLTAAMAASTSTKEKASHHVQSAAITTQASSSAGRRRHGRMSF